MNIIYVLICLSIPVVLLIKFAFIGPKVRYCYNCQFDANGEWNISVMHYYSFGECPWGSGWWSVKHIGTLKFDEVNDEAIAKYKKIADDYIQELVENEKKIEGTINKYS